MAFRKLPDNRGLVYIPECTCKKGEKKHPCADCFNCQWCGNERCRVCRPDDYAPNPETVPEPPADENGESGP